MESEPKYGPSPLAACYGPWLECQRMLDKEFRRSLAIPIGTIESSIGSGYSGAKVAAEMFERQLGIER